MSGLGWPRLVSMHQAKRPSAKWTLDARDLDMLVPRKDIGAIFFIRTIDSLGFSATVPFFGVYLLEARATPLATIALVYLVSGILTIISQVLAGRVSDAIGPRTVMLWGFAISFAFALLLGYLVLENASAIDFLVLYPIFSLLRGASRPATAALVAGGDPKARRSGFAWLYMGGNLGFAIGPALSGVIIDLTNYATVFLVSAAAAAIAMAGTAAWIRTPAPGADISQRPPASRWLHWQKDRVVILLIFLLFCMYIAIGYEIQPMSLFVADVYHFSNTQIGYLFATNGLLIVLLQLPMTRLIEEVRPLLSPLILSAALAVAAFVAAGLARTFITWEIVIILITLAEILCTVPAQTILSLFAAEGNRGTFQGYVAGAASAGRAAASFIGPTSFAIFAAHPAFAWDAIAVFALATGVGLVFLAPAVERAL
ncbi:MAG: MFS transporter [Thermoplasmatota archaeon]